MIHSRLTPFRRALFARLPLRVAQTTPVEKKQLNEGRRVGWIARRGRSYHLTDRGTLALRAVCAAPALLLVCPRCEAPVGAECHRRETLRRCPIHHARKVAASRLSPQAGDPPAGEGGTEKP